MGGFIVALGGSAAAELLDTALREEGHLVQTDQVDQWLNGAADVEEGKTHRLHQATEHVGGVVVLKGEERHGRKVVAHDNHQDVEHRLEGPLLHGVHLVLPDAAGSLQGPQDANFADDHPGERRHDLAGEHLLKVGESSHDFGRGVGEGEAEHQHGEAHPVLHVLELAEHDGEEDGDEAVQADAGEEEGPTGVLHAVGELDGGPHVLAVPVVKVDEVEGGHDAKVDVHEGQAAQEDVRGGRVLEVTDENGDDQQVGGDPHDDVDALQRQVKEDALHHLLAAVEHAEGLCRGIGEGRGVDRQWSGAGEHAIRSGGVALHDCARLN